MFSLRLFFEKKDEQQGDGKGYGSGYEPYAVPLGCDGIACGVRVILLHSSREEGADQHPQSVGSQGNEPLRRGFERFTCFLVGVNHTAHEEEVVAYAM